MEVFKENLNITHYLSKNWKLRSDPPAEADVCFSYCTADFINMTEVLKVVFLNVHNAHAIGFFLY